MKWDSVYDTLQTKPCIEAGEDEDEVTSCSGITYVADPIIAVLFETFII